MKDYSNTIRGSQRRSYKNFLSVLEKIISFLVSNSLFIALVCVFLTYTSFEFLNVQPNVVLLFAVFLSTFSIYSLNRLTDMEEDLINAPEREVYVKGKEKTLLALCILSYGVALLLGFLVKPESILVLLFPLFIGVLYSMEFSRNIPRLKNISGMKNISVSLSWTVGAVFLPLIFKYPGFLVISLLFYFVFVKCLVDTISFDIRDIEGDKKSGVKTIPVLLGRSKTRLLLLGVQSTLIIWLSVAILKGVFVHYWLIFAFSIIYGYWLIQYFSKDRKLKVFSRDLFVDGEWMILAALCFMINIHF